MASTSIEWTNGGKVWNPTTGCNKVSPGCKNCYAEKMHKRLTGMGQEKYQRPFLMGAFPHEPSLMEPFKWKKGKMIFVNSMSDLFHEAVPLDFIAKVYAVMFLTPQHTYQVLTKRPDIRRKVLTSLEFKVAFHRYCNSLHDQHIQRLEQELYFYVETLASLPLKNVWEGTSVENQDTLLERWPELQATPAAVRWISMEPMLSQVNMHEVDTTGLDWIVVGGESGPKKRPFDCDWARDIRDYCERHNIAFFMKQVDKVRAIPETLMIRQYPKQQELV